MFLPHSLENQNNGVCHDAWLTCALSYSIWWEHAVFGFHIVLSDTVVFVSLFTECFTQYRVWQFNQCCEEQQLFFQSLIIYVVFIWSINNIVRVTFIATSLKIPYVSFLSHNFTICTHTHTHTNLWFYIHDVGIIPVNHINLQLILFYCYLGMWDLLPLIHTLGLSS